MEEEQKNETGRTPQPGDLKRLVLGMLCLPEEAMPDDEPQIERCEVNNRLRIGACRVETHMLVERDGNPEQ